MRRSFRVFAILLMLSLAGGMLASPVGAARSKVSLT